MVQIRDGLPRSTAMAETTVHVPATLIRGVFLQELLARVLVGLAAFHAIQAQTIEGKPRLSDSDVDRVLEIVLAGTRVASGGLGDELKLF